MSQENQGLSPTEDIFGLSALEDIYCQAPGRIRFEMATGWDSITGPAHKHTSTRQLVALLRFQACFCVLNDREHAFLSHTCNKRIFLFVSSNRGGMYAVSK